MNCLSQWTWLPVCSRNECILHTFGWRGLACVPFLKIISGDVNSPLQPFCITMYPTHELHTKLYLKDFCFVTRNKYNDKAYQDNLSEDYQNSFGKTVRGEKTSKQDRASHPNYHPATLRQVINWKLSVRNNHLLCSRFQTIAVHLTRPDSMNYSWEGSHGIQ